VDEIEQACKLDAWFWFQNFVYTRDPQDFENPVKKFPDYPFIKNLVEVICERGAMDKPANPRVAIPKSRQMLVSWTCCACSLWLAKFYPERHNFLQSQKEDKAIELLERCKFIEEHSPRQVGAQFEFSQKLARGDNGSKIQAVAQGPDQIAQYTPSQIVLDETALQETAEYSYRSMIPALRNGGQLVAPSTPRGKNFFWQLCHTIDAMKVIRVHYRDHPDFQEKAEELGGWVEWADYMRKKEGYKLQDWNQEMEIDFDVAFGTRVFPDFTLKTHVSSKPLSANPRWTIYEGWDFGYVHPATIWYQYNPMLKQYMVLREMVGNQIDLPTYVKDHVLPMRRKIAMSGVFEAFCDPAGNSRDEKGDRSVDVLRNFGINPRFKKSSLEFGVEVMRANLKLMPDGRSRTIIDPRCSQIIRGLNGGVVYEDIMSEKETVQTKIKWGRYKHIFDAWRYAQIHESGLAHTRKPWETKKHAPRGGRIGSNLEWIQKRAVASALARRS
jgi:hypothetical protein